jgi:hypothetical protein
VVVEATTVAACCTLIEVWCAVQGRSVGGGPGLHRTGYSLQELMGKPGAAAPPVLMSRSLMYCRSSSCIMWPQVAVSTARCAEQTVLIRTCAERHMLQTSWVSTCEQHGRHKSRRNAVLGTSWVPAGRPPT